MKSLREALGAWTPSGGAVAASDPMTELRAAWPEIVGEKIAANAFPTEVERGALVVTTRSAAWSQQLSFLSERILARVRQCAPAARIERVRFRVGRMPARPRAAGRHSHGRAIPAATGRREPTATTGEAFARFRRDVEAFRRAKQTAGWKECTTCGVWIAPRAGTLCVSCADARYDERARVVARLLYEAPWLGYEAVAAAVGALERDEYERIRTRLLARWWDILRRARRAGRLSRDGHERLIASSYVLLKSGVEPERIVPATVRNVLGDELHDLLYGTDTTETANVQ